MPGVGTVVSPEAEEKKTPEQELENDSAMAATNGGFNR